MARKTLYDPETFPQLAEGFAREGLTDIQIAKNLGISKTRFYEYQKEYPEFRNSIKRGKAPVDFEVENALLKRAKGFEYEETHTTVFKNKKGEEIKEIKVITKMVVPDTGAIAFWLKNRMPLKWRERSDLKIDYEKLTDNQLDQIIEKLKESSKTNGKQ
ncbi:MAG: hypothetical protein AB7E36_14855 [Salinivirgaceae bacterium]